MLPPYTKLGHFQAHPEQLITISELDRALTPLMRREAERARERVRIVGVLTEWLDRQPVDATDEPALRQLCRDLCGPRVWR